MNSERIDHKAEALLAIRWAGRDVSANYELQTGEKKSDVLALGQLHATLALAEQQRIANLIALGQYRIVPGDLAPHRSIIFAPPKSDWDVTLRDDVKEGLGLS